MNKKRRIIKLMCAAGASIILFSISGCGEEGSSDSVAVVKVSSLGELESTASDRFSGIIETQKRQSIKLEKDKKVKEIKVKEGDHVNMGDVLFVYDTQSMELEIQQKEIEIEKLDMQIAGYNDRIAELEKQINSGSLSASDRLSYSAEILEAQTSSAQSEYEKKTKDAEIQKLEASVTNASVRSVIDGTVESVKDLSALTEENNIFMEIIADGDLRVKGMVSEQNMSSVSEGMEVLIRSRADSSKTWSGRITSVESKPEQSDQSGGGNTDVMSTASRYAFYVDLDSTEELMLGQHVTIEAFSDMRAVSEGVFVPDGYVLSEGEKQFVWSAEAPGSPLEKKYIQAGEMNEELGGYEITDGLSAEDYIAWPDDSCREGVSTISEN